MVAINYANREVSCKIVYYGPGLSGKTTNLQYIHGKVPGTTRGDLISLATDADRTLYFDFLPINIGDINGFTTRFQLYTVPGQVFYNATRKLVLRGVDGLIFVADSQREKADENIESFNNLRENLEEYGYDIATLPIILQYNKRDLPDIMSIEELNQLMNTNNWPVFESVAHKGKGVFDTLKLIIKMILDKAKKSDTARKIEDSKTGSAPVTAAEPVSASEPAPELVQAAQQAAPPEEAKPAVQPKPAPKPIEVPKPRETAPAEPHRIAASVGGGGSATAVAEPQVRTSTAVEEETEEGVIRGFETNTEFNQKTDNGFEENALGETEEAKSAVRTATLPQDAGPAGTAEQNSAHDIENNFNRQPADDQQSSAFNAEESGDESEDDGDDPFALPSQKPQMAAPMKVKQKKRKGFFLFRWLFGRK